MNHTQTYGTESEFFDLEFLPILSPQVASEQYTLVKSEGVGGVQDSHRAGDTYSPEEQMRNGDIGLNVGDRIPRVEQRPLDTNPKPITIHNNRYTQQNGYGSLVGRENECQNSCSSPDNLGTHRIDESLVPIDNLPPRLQNNLSVSELIDDRTSAQIELPTYEQVVKEFYDGRKI